MAVHIQLDRPHAYFTNLDIITGRAILTIFGEETISAVNVKLECESRTRLAAPSHGGRRDRAQTELEVHKVSKYCMQIGCVEDTSDGLHSFSTKYKRCSHQQNCCNRVPTTRVLHYLLGNMNTLFNSR